jgi:hypothetical protein
MIEKSQDNGDKTGGADDGSSGATGGDDTGGVQLAGGCKHDVDVFDDGEKAGGEDDGVSGETEKSTV